MKKEIRYCKNCKKYTLKNACPICNKKTIKNIPLKFSFEDIGRKYRIIKLRKDLEI